MTEFTNIVVPDGVTFRSENVKSDTYKNSFKGTIYLQAKEGFRFKTDTKPNIEWTKVINSYGQTQKQTEIAVGVYESDTLYRKSFSYVYYTDSKIEFSGDFVEQATPPPEPEKITISQTLSNCTTNAPEYISDTDTAVNISVSAVDGYEFEETPKILVNETNIFLFAVSSDKTTAQIVFNVQEFGFDNIQSFEVVARATAKPTPPPEPEKTEIEKDLQNCTTNAPEYIFETDTAVNITATANTGYIFQETPFLFILTGYGYYDEVQFSVSENKETAQINFNVQEYGFDNIQSFEVVARATAKPTPPPEPEKITISQTLSNCTTNAPEYISDTDTAVNITATANTNAVFNVAPYIHYFDWFGQLNEILFEVSSDKKTANAVFNVQEIGFENIQSITITADAEVITPYSGKYGTINVYCVTNENLEEFSTKRFFQISGDMQVTEIDLGKYVSALRKVYFNIGEVANDVLKCGNHNTNIAVKTPLNDLFTFDCGFITIPSHNGNVTDFENEIKIFLPFVGFVSLSSEYVGKNIYLEYVCNLITTNAVAKLYCDGICFDVHECNISNDIIYKTSDTANELKNIGGIDFNMDVLKGLSPYAVVKYFDSANNHLYNSACERVKIADVSGFAKFEEITDFENPNITDTEKEKIYSLLSDGVIVL